MAVRVFPGTRDPDPVLQKLQGTRFEILQDLCPDARGKSGVSGDSERVPVVPYGEAGTAGLKNFRKFISKNNKKVKKII